MTQVSHFPISLPHSVIVLWIKITVFEVMFEYLILTFCHSAFDKNYPHT